MRGCHANQAVDGTGPDAQRLATAVRVTGLMMKIATGLAFGGLIFAMVFASAAPASADRLKCGNQQPVGAHHAGCIVSGAATAPLTREFAAQKKRPRVIIYPRRVYPGPYAKRQCYSWLVTEYRVSGPVITPQMRCWWQ